MSSDFLGERLEEISSKARVTMRFTAITHETEREIVAVISGSLC